MVVFRFYQLTNLLTIPVYPTITPINGVAQVINTTAVQPNATLIYDLAIYSGFGGQQAVGISNSPVCGGLEAVGPSWPQISASNDNAGYFFAMGNATNFTVDFDGYGFPGGSNGVPGHQKRSA